MAAGVDVAVQHDPDKVVLFAAEPGFDYLGGVIGENAYPVAPQHTEVQQGRADTVRPLVEFREREAPRPIREGHPGPEALRCGADQNAGFDLHGSLLGILTGKYIV